MTDAQRGWSDEAIRWTTTISVIVLAGIAAVLSYKHMYMLVREYGETSWALLVIEVPPAWRPIWLRPRSWAG
ncbi:hypothetical protein OHR68_06970 [Spirillospora sp. NBC_00431]